MKQYTVTLYDKNGTAIVTWPVPGEDALDALVEFNRSAVLDDDTPYAERITIEAVAAAV